MFLKNITTRCPSAQETDILGLVKVHFFLQYNKKGNFSRFFVNDRDEKEKREELLLAKVDEIFKANCRQILEHGFSTENEKGARCLGGRHPAHTIKTFGVVKSL